MRIRLVACFYCIASLVSVAANAAETITPGRSLYVHFDVVQTPWAGQTEVYDPNLIFLQFRGGVTFSQKSVVTATLFIDGVELGSTPADNACSLCASTTWQFASTGFSPVPIFPNPTTVDFSGIRPGSKGLIVLTVRSGFMHFAVAPYTENSPVVVFDNIASCGSGCTSIRPVTMDAQNLLYEVAPASVASLNGARTDGQQQADPVADRRVRQLLLQFDDALAQLRAVDPGFERSRQLQFLLLCAHAVPLSRDERSRTAHRSPDAAISLRSCIDPPFVQFTHWMDPPAVADVVRMQVVAAARPFFALGDP